MRSPALPWADSGVKAGRQHCDDRPTDRRRRSLSCTLQGGYYLPPSLALMSNLLYFPVVYLGEGKGGTRGEGEVSPHSPHVFHNHVPRRTSEHTFVYVVRCSSAASQLPHASPLRQVVS